MSDEIPTMTVAQRMLRWEEVDKLRQIIGWSLQTLAERLGHNNVQVIYKLKKGAAEMPDSDLEWLRQLAELVENCPRPPVVYAPARFSGASVPANSVEGNASMDQIVAGLADVYRTALGNAEGSELDGAQWAVLAMADKFGCRDRVMKAVELRTAIERSDVKPEWRPPA